MVGKHLKHYSTLDANSVAREYEDCYPVDYTIAMDRVNEQKAEYKGHAEKKVVMAAIQSHLPEIQGCYNDSLNADPSLSGALTVRLTFDEKGHCIGTAMSPDLTGGVEGSIEAFSNCAIEKMKSWQLPPEAAGEKTEISYPFILREKTVK